MSKQGGPRVLAPPRSAQSRGIVRIFWCVCSSVSCVVCVSCLCSSPVPRLSTRSFRWSFITTIEDRFSSPHPLVFLDIFLHFATIKLKRPNVPSYARHLQENFTAASNISTATNKRQYHLFVLRDAVLAVTTPGATSSPTKCYFHTILLCRRSGFACSRDFGVIETGTYDALR